ncbi:MAG: GNAT family N-acetyltransferase, partial [Pseudomonadota bacterium]|nr:GNAT family N-acetyltransferase [Pseudomonadota bacterium]
MRASFDIRQITAIDFSMLEALSGVLQACVASGASVGFMNPFDAKIGREFWTDIGQQVTRGDRLLLIAEAGGSVIGTVQVVLAQPRNQPHRGEISKLLVSPTARERGVGQALMLAAESHAAALGKSLLVLDTASDAARRLYARLG